MTTCLNLIQKLNQSIYTTNTELINRMTDLKMRYDWVCIKPELTYDNYYQQIKKDWENIINDFVNRPDKCSNSLSDLSQLYNYTNSDKLTEAGKIIQSLSETNFNLTSRGLASVNLDNIALDIIASEMLREDRPSFIVEKNAMETINNLATVLSENCQCQLVDIFRTIIKKYKSKYRLKFQGKTKDEVIDLIRNDYRNFKNLTKNLDSNFSGNILEILANRMTNLYSFSIEDELDRLVPDELGSLKKFFITIINHYYANLHPIVWAQIFRSMTEDWFVDLPYTSEELFQFGSKHLLLNSGPFILKTLQMIRPALSPELASRYNLTKLTYPLLEPEQVDLILRRCVYYWDMYRILANYSASVGHVCKVIRVDNPTIVYIIKIIKPLAVAQSCWEYQILHDLFSEGTCERKFVQHILESNGRELNVKNEIENIDKGYNYYTAAYNEIYGVDINAKLTTVQNIDGVILKDTWFALAMTLAPGIPISKLVEDDLIGSDTPYRAKLHRCLDILVYKFFHTIIKYGFYHGDLHSGNIFYSYRESQITLIDFGAVGNINIYSADPDTRILLDTVVMGIFNNYDQILDELTDLLNTKCDGSDEIDKNSMTYAIFKQKLIRYKINNIIREKSDSIKSKQYEKNLFSKIRIDSEKTAEKKTFIVNKFDPDNIHSIYDYLEYRPTVAETIVENSEVLPSFTNIDSQNDESFESSVGFALVLEEIIKFYASNGVNVAIKFNEFYEFQKAYALLLGVLYKVHYPGYRSGMAIKKSILNLSNIAELRHLSTISHVTKTYFDQKSIYKNFKQSLKLPM